MTEEFVRHVMKTLLVLASVLAILFLVAPDKVEAQKKTAVRTIDGTISEYSCGDNCYLTITDKYGRERIGLCNAPLCSIWDDELPTGYKGKKVRVKVGKALRYDGSGNVVDKYDAFIKIQFLTTVATAQPSAGNWFVILGSFPKSQSENANQRLRYIQNLGYQASIIDTDDYSGLRDGFYSVVLGPYSKAAAQRSLSSIRTRIRDAYVKSGS